MTEDNKKLVKIYYKNWKGESSIRTVYPLGPFYWGSNEFHKEEQWLFDVFDYDKQAKRTYAFKDIISVLPN